MNPVQARFRAAMDLHELMVAMHRQLLVREDPTASDQVINRRLQEWLLGDPAPPTHLIAEADKTKP